MPRSLLWLALSWVACAPPAAPSGDGQMASAPVAGRLPALAQDRGNPSTASGGPGVPSDEGCPPPAPGAGGSPSGDALDLRAPERAGHGAIPSRGCPDNRRPPRIVVSTEIEVLRPLLFPEGHAAVPPGHEPLLHAVVRLLDEHPTIARLDIVGHADEPGSPAVLQALSEKRAQAVRDALIALGASPARLSARGVSNREPLSTRRGPAEMAANRRVELRLAPPK